MKWRLARDALIVTIFVLFGVWLAFGQDKPDFAGATTCSCKIEPVGDNLGNVNGYQVAVDLQYQDPHKLRWNRTVQLYRPEDLKKAHKYCIQLYKQLYKENRLQILAKHRKESDLTTAQR
jgi:hypothetical protein